MNRAGLIVILGLMAYVLYWGYTEAQIVAREPCGASLACLQQRILDLQEHRAFLEDQLALAKSLNAALQGQLAACRATPDLPPRQAPAIPEK